MSISIIPAIDLRSGRCVRLRQGRKDKATLYDGDPIEIAVSYETAGAQMVHIVDLDGAFSDPNSLNRQVIRQIIKQLRTPVQFGGGLRSLGDIEQALNMGVSRVIIGSMAADRPRQMLDVLGHFGPEQIVLGLDVKDGKVATHGWRQLAETDALELVQLIQTAGLTHVIYTDISRDGMLSGINMEAIVALARALKVRPARLLEKLR